MPVESPSSAERTAQGRGWGGRSRWSARRWRSCRRGRWSLFVAGRHGVRVGRTRPGDRRPAGEGRRRAGEPMVVDRHDEDLLVDGRSDRVCGGVMRGRGGQLRIRRRRIDSSLRVQKRRAGLQSRGSTLFQLLKLRVTTPSALAPVGQGRAAPSHVARARGSSTQRLEKEKSTHSRNMILAPANTTRSFIFIPRCLDHPSQLKLPVPAPPPPPSAG